MLWRQCQILNLQYHSRNSWLAIVVAQVTALAQVWSLAQEFLYAMDMAKKKKKKKKFFFSVSGIEPGNSAKGFSTAPCGKDQTDVEP